MFILLFSRSSALQPCRINFPDVNRIGTVRIVFRSIENLFPRMAASESFWFERYRIFYVCISNMNHKFMDFRKNLLKGLIANSVTKSLSSITIV